MLTSLLPNLSPAELERLACLSEELGEAQQAIGKILRHGYESHHPDDWRRTNRDDLERELGDVLATIGMLTDAGDLNVEAIDNARISKRLKVRRFLHHQGPSKENR